MIRRLLSRLIRRRPEIRREATVLLTMHESPQHAWLAARDRREAAQKDARWSEDREIQRLSRYWNSVMREIERQSGYSHQPDTATRYLER
ncbi:hypothetical protein [Aurantimonas sp. HBX-1]|uniref:hypothetical protein n=1 Tax=Aurantimonas sp. HBX-1 TaxID=2906072 RepID=UPI001F34CCA3|nr:hypothetical protein [Aurantimonas sp. HBX-1]UIJ73373.1 hypothetical protein LXB15_06980 [Aurantimonas sp. HBX-1]